MTGKRTEDLPCSKSCIYTHDCGTGFVEQRTPCAEVISGTAHRLRRATKSPEIVTSAKGKNTVNFESRFRVGREGNKRPITLPTGRQVESGALVRKK